jgi:hypothetical protein
MRVSCNDSLRLSDRQGFNGHALEVNKRLRESDHSGDYEVLSEYLRDQAPHLCGLKGQRGSA